MFFEHSLELIISDIREFKHIENALVLIYADIDILDICKAFVGVVVRVSVYDFCDGGIFVKLIPQMLVDFVTPLASILALAVRTQRIVAD